MRLLTADEILSADDTVFVEVPTPEWGAGAGVRVRSINSAERGRWEASIQRDGKKKGDWEKARARLVTMAAVDANGARLFHNPEQLDRLARKNSAPVSRIVDKILEISGVSEEEHTELEGEFRENPTESPPTD